MVGTPAYAKKHQSSKFITRRDAITIDTIHLGNQKKITKSNRWLITKSVITLAMLSLLSLVGFSIYTRNQHSDDIKLLRDAKNEQIRQELAHQHTGCEKCTHKINFFTESRTECCHFSSKNLRKFWEKENKIGLGKDDEHTLSLYISEYFALWYLIRDSNRAVPLTVERLGRILYPHELHKRMAEQRHSQKFLNRLNIIAKVPCLTAKDRAKWTEADIRGMDFILKEAHRDIEEFVTALEKTEPKDEDTLRVRRMFFTDSNKPTSLRKLMQKPDLIRWAMAIPSLERTMLSKLERFIPGSAI